MHADTGDVTITDIYGRTRRRPVAAGSVALDLTESPIFIPGLADQDIGDRLTPIDRPNAPDGQR